MHRLEEILISSGVSRAAMIKYSDCSIVNSKPADRLSFTPKSVCIGIIPYYTRYCNQTRTVSAYALAEDYHNYIAAVGKSALEVFRHEYPSYNAAFFGDHSPINEKLAAARAGLGIIGMNSLLITPDYSSYVFLCELITDMECENTSHDITMCENCGACIDACPGFLKDEGDCLSAVTQKKGILTEAEINLIRHNKTAWGCDICQEVCPHTIKAKESGTIYTDNPWFNTNVLAEPNRHTVNSEDFARRAYSWRGKQTILRNIEILKESDKQ